MLAALRKHKLYVALVLAIAGGAVFFAVRKVAGNRVEVRQPQRGEMVQTLVTSGRVRPVRIRLAPIITGVVTAVEVKEGQRVSTGQLLVRLDDSEAKALLANRKAALKRAIADQKKLRTLSKKDADEGLKQARVRLDEAKRNFDRNKKLLDAGAVTQAQYDQAATNLTLARSVLRTATNLQRDLRQGGATQLSSDAALALARADLALAEARLGYTELRAPTDGVVLTRTVEVGDSVGANSEVLTVAATGRTELVIQPDERNLALLRLGQQAIASAEAFPKQRFAAKVSFIAPSVDRRRGTIEVRLVVKDVPAYLRPDMTVSVDIEVARKADALTVPIGAVSGIASNAPSLLIAKKGRAVRVPVTVGIRDSQRAEITAGLTGDELVIQNPTEVSEGARIRPRRAAP